MNWDKFATAFSDAHADKLCKSRGYSKETVRFLRDNLLVGIYDGMIAFPTECGAHYKSKNGWRYTEGAKASAYVIGNIDEGAHVHVFESQWDAIAYSDASGERSNIVATRGASNGKLAVQAVGEYFSGTLYLWPQNDVPGKKWADDIRRLFPGQIKVVAINPFYGSDAKPIKDLCEWRKSGATDGDIWQAFIDAKDFAGGGDLDGNHEPQKSLPATPATISTNCGVVSMAALKQGGEFPSANAKEASPSSSNLAKELTAAPVLAEPSTEGGNVSDNLVGGEAREATDDPAVERLSIGRLDSHGGGQYLQKGGDATWSSTQARVGLTPMDESEPISNAAPTVQSLGAALNSSVAFLRKYMRFEDDWEAPICALWAVHCWIFTAFPYTPYLHILSPEKRCGKTRLMDCLESLVPNPWRAISPSEAVLYRKVAKDKPVLFLDEVDTIFGEEGTNEPIRALLNGGYDANIKVPRCIGKTGDFEEFTVFCPKALAGIGTMPDTIADRCIHIPLARQPSEDRAERFRKLEAAIEVREIRTFLSSWSQENMTTMSRSRPQLPSDLDGRHMDIAEPLLAVAEAAGDEWADKGREVVITAFEQPEELSDNTKLLKLIRACFLTKGGEARATTEILEFIVQSEDSEAPWIVAWERQMKHDGPHGPSQKLGRMVKNFKNSHGERIRPRNIRQGDQIVKGYRREDFEHAWKRYLASEIKVVPMELELAV